MYSDEIIHYMKKGETVKQKDHVRKKERICETTNEEA